MSRAPGVGVALEPIPPLQAAKAADKNAISSHWVLSRGKVAAIVGAVIGFLEEAEGVSPTPAVVGRRVLMSRISHLVDRIISCPADDTIVAETRSGSINFSSPGNSIIGSHRRQGSVGYCSQVDITH